MPNYVLLTSFVHPRSNDYFSDTLLGDKNQRRFRLALASLIFTKTYTTVNSSLCDGMINMSCYSRAARPTTPLSKQLSADFLWKDSFHRWREHIAKLSIRCASRLALRTGLGP